MFLTQLRDGVTNPCRPWSVNAFAFIWFVVLFAFDSIHFLS